MHLIKRNRVFHYNRRVPCMLQTFIGAPSIRISLKVRDRQQALLLGRRIDNELDLLILRMMTEEVSPEFISEKLNRLGINREKSGHGDKSRLRELFARYVDDRLTSGKWIDKTALENRRSFALFQEWSGSISLQDVDHKMLLEYRDLLRQLPPNISTNHATRGKNLKEVIAMKHERVLSIAQVNKYLVTLSAFFSWLHEHEFIKHNPAHHLLLGKPARSNSAEERSAYNIDEIRQIRDFLLKDRSAIIESRPERFWVPMIALYSGMRQTEISQLYCADIVEYEGIWCFSVNEEAEDKRLKNASSIRLVPVHPALLEFGLIEYRGSLKTGRLFQKLTKEQYNGYGRQMSKWFTTFNRRYITQDPKKTFHSIRHSVANELKQLKVPGEVISELLGHKVDSITMNRYGKRYRPEVLLEAIKQLPW